MMCRARTGRVGPTPGTFVGNLWGNMDLGDLPYRLDLMAKGGLELPTYAFQA